MTLCDSLFFVAFSAEDWEDDGTIKRGKNAGRERQRHKLSGRTRAKPVPAHRQTLDEFRQTVTHRTDVEPALSVAQWAAIRGLTYRPLNDFEHADMLGSALATRVWTRASRGKLMGLARRHAAAREVELAYQGAVHLGEVPKVEKVRPLRPDSDADDAYVRVLHKRAIRRAMARGKTVPLRVIQSHR